MLHRWRLLPTGTWYSSLLSFSHSVVSDSFWPMDCSMPGFPVLHHFPELSQLMSIESMMPSNHFVLCHPFLLLPSVFPSIRVSSHQVAKVLELQLQHQCLPMNIQGWFPLGMTGLDSLLSKGFSTVFSSTTIQKHQFLEALSFLYGPTLSSVHVLEKP